LIRNRFKDIIFIWMFCNCLTLQHQEVFMRKLVIISVIMALMNSFIRMNYIANTSGSAFKQPRCESFIHSILPIDSFVLPVQGVQSIVHHQLKTNTPVTVFFSPYSSCAQWVITKSFFYSINKVEFITSLSLIKVVVLRV
jgi:hypothetical protein